VARESGARSLIARRSSPGHTEVDGTVNLPTYYLREDSFVCLADRHYVILDLLADKYLRVEKQPFEALAPLTSLSSSPSANSRESRNHELTAESRILLSELLERGLLTENPDKANARAVETVAKPIETLTTEVCSASVTLSMRYIPAFTSSVRLAAAWLKQPISQTVDRVIDRKRRRGQRPEQFNTDRARVLISIFCRLRPFHNRQFLCLFDSLALLNFLARYEIFPTWVFGVQSEPFAAHCWVQHNDILLNDTLDGVSAYTPLLAV
jgi:hypothetical protein